MLIAVERVMSAGVVSTEIATLTAEVMKMMLLGKLKIIVVMLLVASAMVAGRTGVAFQAQTIEPSQKDDLQRLIGEKAEELRQFIAKQKQGGQPTEGRELRPEDPARIALGLDERKREPQRLKRDNSAFSADRSLGDGLPDLSELEGYSPDQLRRQKEYIDGMIEVENARNKTPEQRDEMIREKSKVLDHFLWCLRVAQAQINKLKKIRDAGHTDKNPRAN
jgi:hypothetical protein